MDELAGRLSFIAVAQDSLARELDGIVKELLGEPAHWAFPVGFNEFPTSHWYSATVHDTTGKLNNGYAHTGIDLNVDKRPWGDVDRGQPVFAVANGVVYRTGYSQSYLGSVVLLVSHNDAPLYVRYWHLADNGTFRSWKEGDVVKADDYLGHIGNYQLGAGGDHLHFDMALDPFEPHWWFTSHPTVRWVDPVPILKAHLDPAQVDEMMERK